MADYASDFFKKNRWVLRCAGLWPPQTTNKKIQAIYKAYSIIVFALVNVYYVTTEFISLFDTYGNIYDLTKNISLALTHLMGSVKVVFFYYNADKLFKIMQELEDDEFHYESCNNYQPGVISKKYKSSGDKCILIFTTLSFTFLSSSYIPQFFTVLSIKLGQNSTLALPKILPDFSWMPFTYQSPERYILALVYQYIPMFVYIFSIVGMDTLFMNITNCIAGHLTIIQGAFLTMKERSAGKINRRMPIDEELQENPKDLMVVMNGEMRKTCRHLQLVFRVCEEFENLYQYLTLALAMATIFILCTSLYLVSIIPVNNKQFYPQILYVVAIAFQLFLYCWFGNEVIVKAEEMSVYIWQCDWLTADEEFKKRMIFTMMRMKRPLCMTVGKFAPLTLSTYVAIIKASYSFFALIKSTDN